MGCSCCIEVAMRWAHAIGVFVIGVAGHCMGHVGHLADVLVLAEYGWKATTAVAATHSIGDRK